MIEASYSQQKGGRSARTLSRFSYYNSISVKIINYANPPTNQNDVEIVCVIHFISRKNA